MLSLPYNKAAVMRKALLTTCRTYVSKSSVHKLLAQTPTYPQRAGSAHSRSPRFESMPAFKLVLLNASTC